MAKAPPKRKPSKLSPKQRSFIAEYLKDKNATQAAIRAGYAENSAQMQGSRLISKAIISNAISKKLRKMEEKTEITAERILKELSHMAFLDMRLAFNPNGTLKPPAEWPDDIARSLASTETLEVFAGTGAMRVKIGETQKVKIWDKTKALELLGKHLKMFTEKVELGGNVNVHYTVKVVAA